jgi:DNA-binding winged helix-turn-helix (wHTH) protein/Tol biopolymer transport system component
MRLGESELNLETAELRNNGNKLTIPAQPFQVLLMLLHRPGALVTREELKQQLWTADTFVDFDQSLNKAVNRLREALADSAEHPRFIETLPKRGYRFIAEVQPVAGDISDHEGEAPASSAQAAEAAPTSAGQSAKQRTLLKKSLVLGLLVGLMAFGAARWWKQSLPIPRVVGMVRITNDGWRKYALMSDGVRLYFSERNSIFQSSIEGGEISELRTGLIDADIYDISAGGSELLVASDVQASETEERPIWAVSLPGGTPRRVGAIKALWACWGPDSEHLAFATRDAIYLAKKDGSDIRKLGDIPAVPWKMQFSPNGDRLRFDGYDAARNVDSIWEMSLDSKQANLLFPKWSTPQHIGNWTADGKYFFFNTHDPFKDRDEDVWVVPQTTRRQAKTVPLQLTKGPLAFGYPLPVADGKKVFVLATQSRAELARYDRNEKQFVPYLAEISAWEAEVSRDAEWIAYVSYPDLTLWRSRADGTQRVQLTFPPIEVVGPRWSPDGTKIAFTDVQPGRPWKIYTISSQGGISQEILPGDDLAEIDGSWWPNGSSILFGRSYFAGKGGIQRVDLKTHQVSTVPGSEKMFSPRLSPDGSKIAAFSEQGKNLLLYDFQQARWRDLARGVFQFNVWSRDGQSIYMLDMTKKFAIARFDVSSGKFEDVATVQHIEQGNRGWIGLAADDSPVLVRDESVSDVYRLDLTE